MIQNHACEHQKRMLLQDALLLQPLYDHLWPALDTDHQRLCFSRDTTVKDNYIVAVIAAFTAQQTC
jgi:hypothetical protein